MSCVQSFQVSRFGGRSPDCWSNNENLPISRFGMKISRFITRNSRLVLAIASFAIAVGETIFGLAIFFLKPFANCVVIGNKYSACGLPPQEDAIFVGTPWSHLLCRAWEASLLRYEWLSIGYPSQRERGLSIDTPSLFIIILLVFFAQCPINLQNKWRALKGKLRSRRRHLSLARATIGTHKSGISSPGQTTSDSDGYFFLYMIGINNICIVYFIWVSKVSELRPSEPRIILLAESGDLDNHNAARRRNG